MYRLLCLFCLCGLFFGSARACDMSKENRPQTLAVYVKNGIACLETPGQGFWFSTEMEQAFVDRINQERSSRGLGPLAIRENLQAAARFHSLDMGINGFFGHKTPNGKRHPARISAFDRTLLPQSTAENVAKLELSCQNWQGEAMSCHDMPDQGADMMAGTVESLHRQLMNSPGHRENILAPETTHIALGVARQDHAVYVTQLFTNPIGVLDQPLPLTLQAGSRFEVSAQMPDWRFKRFAVMEDNFPKDVFDGRLPVTARGDLILSVRGERSAQVETAGQETVETYEFIYLAGPSFTAIAASGSS